MAKTNPPTRFPSIPGLVTEPYTKTFTYVRPTPSAIRNYLTLFKTKLERASNLRKTMEVRNATAANIWSVVNDIEIEEAHKPLLALHLLFLSQNLGMKKKPTKALREKFSLSPKDGYDSLFDSEKFSVDQMGEAAKSIYDSSVLGGTPLPKEIAMFLDIANAFKDMYIYIEKGTYDDYIGANDDGNPSHEAYVVTKYKFRDNLFATDATSFVVYTAKGQLRIAVPQRKWLVDKGLILPYTTIGNEDVPTYVSTHPDKPKEGLIMEYRECERAALVKFIAEGGFEYHKKFVTETKLPTLVYKKGDWYIQLGGYNDDLYETNFYSFNYLIYDIPVGDLVESIKKALAANI